MADIARTQSTVSASQSWEASIERLKERASIVSPSSQVQQQVPPGEEELEQAVQHVNNTIKLTNTALKVEWNRDTDRKVVAVLDTSTGDVLRQIPARDFVEWEEAYVELLGMLFDRKV